jgi:hypothetical protein
MCIVTGTFVLGFSLFKWATLNPHETDVQRGSPLQRGHVKVEADHPILVRMSSERNVIPMKGAPV